ncbi:MAG TPA: hypothetical protein DIU48_09950 [Acidobacteria bacterium]|jgi:hypothetical protein|uniref:VanZ-like domain-containing protein n=1 Tax=marine metagenome TaxID=408172 RepID=A0A381TKT1_9ZZZZ|nr:hypothetical protein [Acidobacteriota bacterium]
MFNYYTISHFLIWLLFGRFTSIGWITFLLLSIGWEILELALPFGFAVETLDNKVGDMVVNTLAFLVGLKWRQSAAQKTKLRTTRP